MDASENKMEPSLQINQQIFAERKAFQETLDVVRSQREGQADLVAQLTVHNNNLSRLNIELETKLQHLLQDGESKQREIETLKKHIEILHSEFKILREKFNKHSGDLQTRDGG